jgi:L-asparaginase
MKLAVFTTGGTIDKIYFDKKSDYEIGDAIIGPLLNSMGVGFDFTVEELMKVDSLDMSEQDRRHIVERVAASSQDRILITHGTDGMIETAKALSIVQGKTIVLTGALQPAAFAHNDAVFNIGGSVAAVQILPSGCYIVMNGRVFTPENVIKNLEKNRFESPGE